MGNKQNNSNFISNDLFAKNDVSVNDKEVNNKFEPINKNNFDFLYVIGKGGFGKVWKVFFKKYKKTYALKEMSKAKILDKKSEKSVQYEKELLSKILHPFIVNMNYAFQDNENIYIVMDLLTGGDLRYHLCRFKKFSEEQSKFFISCILLGLEYLHTNNIIHRDIKPENLVLDERGYVRITDFGIAKVFQKENFTETSGTPGYMSPEVMLAQNHTIAVDYYALGVLAFEFMFGYRPYLGKTRKEIKEKIMSKQVQIKKNEIPEGWSTEAADFTNRLLQRKPSNRLGLRGAQEVKEHAWLKYYHWKDLYEKQLESPFMPKNGDHFDAKYCNAIDKIGNQTKERYDSIIKNITFLRQAFKDFYFYFNDQDLSDLLNSKSKKFFNPHLNISVNFSKNNEEHYIIEKNINEKLNLLNNLDSKFSKIKMISNSGTTASNSSVIRHYRQSSSNNLSNDSTNVTNNHNFNLNNSKRSGSVTHFQY